MRNLLAASSTLLLVLSPALAVQDDEKAPLPEDVKGLVTLLKEQRDNAEVDAVKKLANIKSREAMNGLLEVYGELGSIYMRRAVCQGLALYDRVADCEQPALQKLMDVATLAKERELREAAVELLGGCSNYGKAFLTMIVESSADDDIRIRAMTHHTGSSRPEDMEWYREIYDPTALEKARKAAKKAKDEKDKVPHALQPLRVLAFEALAGSMEVDELVEAASDGNRKIRAEAIDQLSSRDEKKAAAASEEIYDRAGEPAPTRIAAAGILLRVKGPRFASQLMKDATKSNAGREFAFGVADLIADLKDESVDKQILKNAGKGKGDAKLFYLRAAKHIDDPKLDKALLKLLKDKDEEARREAMRLLGLRGNEDAVPELEKAIEKDKDPLVLAAALEAMCGIRRNDAEWEMQLVAYTHHEADEIRNAAVVQVGRTKNPDHLPVLLEALEHERWSTRLAAARGIEEMREKEGVGALCTRIGKETGRMLGEMSDVLWRLTGKSFRTNPKLWERWWADEGGAFEIIDPSKLRALEQEEEARRLKQISTTEFFGIRIQSHRVTFILDVSGSMREPTRGMYVGEDGAPRIDVAKQELLKALDGLERDSLFNIVTFSGDVDAWQDRVSENNAESMEEAKSFVERLGANGGTNLYGSLDYAFDDPDVDTIFVLSDGEPTAGSVVDPMAIRQVVQRWNENRGVVIHCIAVGGSLQVLEWLAEDTGGTYVKFP